MKLHDESTSKTEDKTREEEIKALKAIIVRAEKVRWDRNMPVLIQLLEFLRMERLRCDSKAEDKIRAMEIKNLKTIIIRVNMHLSNPLPPEIDKITVLNDYGFSSYGANPGLISETLPLVQQFKERYPKEFFEDFF